MEIIRKNELQEILDLVKMMSHGKFLITGAAGSGKTFLLNIAGKILWEQGKKIRYKNMELFPDDKETGDYLSESSDTVYLIDGLDNFDNTQFEAEARKKPQMAVAWSNESIELWFLLYFEDYCSDNGRKQYIEKLNKYFDYSKKREDLYDILNSLGSQEEAKRRARKMYAEFVDAHVTSMSAMVPATRVFELVEELESYLEK